jgi:CheY-like chemotaxis protein
MGATSTYRVLVVDDNVDAADLLGLFLGASGHQVATEYHPAKALTRAQSELFDVFVLDIGLPDMDGYELARRLLALPECEAALFIALTGYGADEDRRKSKAAGFHHHFVKPASIEKLMSVLVFPSEPTNSKIRT